VVADGIRVDYQDALRAALRESVMIRNKWIALALTASICAASAWPASAAQAQEENDAMRDFNALIEAYGKDVLTIGQLYHDDLAYGHSGGSFETKSQVMRGLPGWRWAKVKSSEVKVTGPVAVIRTVMDFQVGGQQVTDMKILWILVKEQQDWKVLVRQAVRTESTIIAPIPAESK
jgi:hypothetical protein